jgi:hypothetical protein
MALQRLEKTHEDMKKAHGHQIERVEAAKDHVIRQIIDRAVTCSLEKLSLHSFNKWKRVAKQRKDDRGRRHAKERALEELTFRQWYRLYNRSQAQHALRTKWNTFHAQARVSITFRTWAIQARETKRIAQAILFLTGQRQTNLLRAIFRAFQTYAMTQGNIRHEWTRSVKLLPRLSYDILYFSPIESFRISKIHVC